MPNMSYCRCQNTVSDLQDVLDGFYNCDISNSKYELNAAYEIVQLCVEIADTYGDMTFDEFVHDVSLTEDGDEYY